MDIQQSLQDLGLNEKEALIYKSLLELGQSTAYAIAVKSGLKRPTVYVILDDLRMRGLVLKIPYPKKQLFQAKPPDELITEASERLRRAQTILPELLSLMNDKKKPRTLYFEGLKGLRQVIFYGIENMSSKEIVGFYAYAVNPSRDLLKMIDEYNEELQRKGISTRGIAPQHTSLKRYRSEDKMYNRIIKTIPSIQYSSNMSLDITENSVRIIDYKNLHGLIIDNSDTAQTMKQIFELVWKNL